MYCNNLVLVFIIFHVSAFFNAGFCQLEIFSHSNMGEYYLDWKYIGPCEKDKVGTNEIQMNVKLTKKNKRPQIFGNYTFLIPWDESLAIHVHFMQLKSNAGWIPNFHQFTLAGCTQFKLILEGNDLFTSMNIPNSCPIPRGVYKLKEYYDVEKIVKSRALPKQFFYGSYKVICDFRKKDATVGCALTALNVLPKRQKKDKSQIGT